jgi:DUF3096 family protein
MRRENSLTRTRTGWPARNSPNSPRTTSFPESRGVAAAIFGIFRGRGNPLKLQASPIAARCKKIKCSRFDISRSDTAETFQMTLTVAHISPVISVIAGLLILIMPRLLNFIVAIFLILNGLIGLGLLKWLHL